MSGGALILPGTGRGTAAAGGGGGGSPHRVPSLCSPSTMLRMVPLPVPGRIV
jgi:hypothetical protein